MIEAIAAIRDHQDIASAVNQQPVDGLDMANEIRLMFDAVAAEHDLELFVDDREVQGRTKIIYPGNARGVLVELRGSCDQSRRVDDLEIFHVGAFEAWLQPGADLERLHRGRHVFEKRVARDSARRDTALLPAVSLIMIEEVGVGKFCEVVVPFAVKRRVKLRRKQNGERAVWLRQQLRLLSMMTRPGKR